MTGPEARERRPSVLVVDDEPDVRELLKDILETAGYEVLTARNGREAIERLTAAAVDLIITDLVMPEQEGIETIVRIRKDYPDVHILAISGAMGPYLKVAKALGARDALPKPFSPEALLERVTQILDP